MKNGNQGDGGGRPEVVFNSEQIGLISGLAAVLTKGQIADYFSVSETTFRAIEERQPEVSDAYKKGRVQQIASMGSNLVKMAKAGNVTAAIFYLKPKQDGKSKKQKLKKYPQLT